MPDTELMERKSETLPETPPRRSIASAGDSAPETANFPHSAESFARKTSGGPVKDVADWDNQAVLAGVKAECAEIRAIDANYPGKYHRLGTLIHESTKRFSADSVRQTLRAEGISKTTAHWAVRIAELYTYEQAVQFASVRAIVRTLPPKQSRSKKADVKPKGGGDHQATAPHEPVQVLPPAVADETILESFIRLGIKVMELFGDEALDQAVEQIKAHVPETFEEAFAEV
ncbi:MAG: hypothetical protein ABSG67_17180 [Thermoguttaceae bacterium]|jgi:hypothetical protein